LTNFALDVDNPVRREMEQIAIKSGLKFIVNVALNREGQVVAIITGDVVQVHQLVALGTTPSAQVLPMIARGEIMDGIAAATYLAYDRTRQRANIVLVSDGITDDDARKIGARAAKD